MAGHSKWANIKHRKGAQDAKRGRLFTKLIREITVAAKFGGEDLGSNPRLRAAVDNALDNNMPKDTVERAIKRGVGGDEATNLEEIRYEGYGPGGVAVMVDCMTDNRNRTAGEVRHAFTKCGGNLGTSGAVSYLFSKRGVFSFEPGVDESKLMEVALDAGVDDIVNQSDGAIDVFTSSDDFSNVKMRLQEANLFALHAEITMHPSTFVNLDLATAETMLKLIEMLDELDDVQKVYSNAEIPSEILAKLS